MKRLWEQKGNNQDSQVSVRQGHPCPQPLTLVAGCSFGTLLSSSATTSCISTRALWLPDSFCSTEKCGIQQLPAALPPQSSQHREPQGPTSASYA